ncbi:hypothetical protein BUALT_Bualt15G0069400 [Buddleja alternifolia]|uniref:Peptidase C14 caspase domain-containing protein n=1 Tax=Buddleja alternifolia TaxID=168488 RepID=A0AAV6WNV7_9LAMI|nr:hypothetical protein BUALT_Bualt15G0069400 [Buddleja alternifolia]
MASKTMRCSYCRTQIVVPPYAHAIQCAACQTIIRFQPNDQTHNSFSPRFKNMARPSPSVVPVSVHGRKRAVLCGISYYGQRYKLDGTVNDVKSMRYFLTQRLGFPSDSILILTEEESDPRLIPTGNNIRKALKWLVQGCQSGDSLVFHYSGHGSQQLDFNRDEVDGYDEILWPVDYQTEGTILDDEINATIVRPLPRGATLHAIIDACHSGTILDLPFVCRINREGYYNWEDHRLPYTAYKGTNGGYAISISACNDNQSSGDTTAFTGKATGALTYSFIKTLEQEPGVTYGRLLMAMHKIIGAARGELGLSSNVSHLSQKLHINNEKWSNNIKFVQAFTGKATGALTYSFIKTLEQEPGVTYGRLLMAMHKIIGAARGELGLSSNVSHLSQKLHINNEKWSNNIKFVQAFTGKATGALTYSFIKTLEQEPGVTYGRLLMAMHKIIGAARGELGLSSNVSHLSQKLHINNEKWSNNIKFVQAFTGKATGALTYSFIKTLEQEPGVTYGRLLMAMHKIIGAARGELGLSSNVSHLSQSKLGTNKQ